MPHCVGSRVGLARCYLCPLLPAARQRKKKEEETFDDPRPSGSKGQIPDVMVVQVRKTCLVFRDFRNLRLKNGADGKRMERLSGNSVVDSRHGFRELRSDLTDGCNNNIQGTR